MRLEGIYRHRVVSILTPIVGAGNVNAQINIDFDLPEQIEQKKLLTQMVMLCGVNRKLSIRLQI